MNKLFPIFYTAITVGLVSCTGSLNKPVDDGSIANDAISENNVTVKTLSDKGTSDSVLKISATPDFIGDYTDSNDGSTLKIGKSINSGPSIKINLFKLTDIDDGIGIVSDDALTFTATDAEGNPIKGKITVDGDSATLVFTESTWEYLPNGSTYHFKRDSRAMTE